MTPSNELFELIKSLNKTEKRYIKLNFPSSENAKYRILFDEIEGAEIYDEKRIKEKFKGEKFIKQLTFTKNYLYNTILNLLISYNRVNSSEIQMTELVIKLRILFKKGLYTQYFKTIRKYKKKAEGYEKFYVLLELIRMQRLVTEIRKFRTIKMEDFYEEEKIIIKKIENIGDYSKLFHTAISLKRISGVSGKQKSSKSADKILNHELLQNPDCALSSQALEYYYHIKQQLYAIKGDKERQYDACLKRLKCIEENPKPFLDDIVNPRREVLYTLAELSIDLGKGDEYKKFLQKYFVTKKSSTKKVNSMLISNFIELKYILSLSIFEGKDDICENVERDLKEFKGKLDKDMEIEAMFMVAKYYFHKRDFKTALRKNNEILSLPTVKFRDDIYSYSRILDILIHFELENYNQVEYLTEAVRKYLGKEKEQYHAEIKHVEIIQKIIPTKNPGKIIERKDSEMNLPESNYSQYLDINSWIRSKTQ